MKKPSGLRLRLALAYMAWSVLVTVLVGFLAYYLLIGRLESHLDDRMQTVCEQLLRKIPRDSMLFAQPQPAVDSSIPYSYIVLDEKGILVRASGDPVLTQLPFSVAAESAVLQRHPVWENVIIDGTRWRLFNAPFTGTDDKAFVVRMGSTLDAIDEVRGEFASALLWLIPFVAFAGAVSAWLILRQALEPVRQISLAAQRITASNLPAILPVRGSGDEMDQVSAAFNSIIAELHAASQRMWQYLSHISHELRTPLAALRAETEVALRWARTEKEYRQVLTSNMEELDRITKTVGDMLDLARAEAGQIELKRKPDNITELARTAVSAMEALAAQRGVTLEFTDSESVVAEIAAEQVLRLILILLDNAIKYSYASGKVKLVVKSRNGWALISVMDRGRGIAPEDLPHIFEHFYRSQNGRTREVEGSGLGLSHADWIVKTHGGRIDVESKIGRGTRFNVWLPVFARAETATA
jgi:heavy metal sensor kinase